MLRRGEGQETLPLGGENVPSSVLKRAYTDVLEVLGGDVPSESEILTDQAKLGQVLELISAEGIREDLRDEFLFEKQRQVGRALAKYRGHGQEGLQKQKGKNWCSKMTRTNHLLAHLPARRYWVFKHMNHLLKGPFCVHPKTGRVCVPIDPAVAEYFDPEAFLQLRSSGP